MLSAHGYPVEEITGGCFCCRFNSLMEASEKLTRRRDAGRVPRRAGGKLHRSARGGDASAAAAVRRRFPRRAAVACWSIRSARSRILGLEPGAAFSPKVRYVYEKQLEEAEVHRHQQAGPGGRRRSSARLKAAIAERYPRAKVFVVSARDGRGPGRVVHLRARRRRRERSGAGHRLRGICRGRGAARLVQRHGDALGARRGRAWTAISFLTALAETLRRQLASKGIDIAHLKMTLSPTRFRIDIAVLNLVRTDGRAELSHTLKDAVSEGELIVNLRAEGDPDVLRAAAARRWPSVGARGGRRRHGRSRGSVQAREAESDVSHGHGHGVADASRSDELLHERLPPPLLPLRLRARGAARRQGRRARGADERRRGVRGGVRSVPDVGAQRSAHEGAGRRRAGDDRGLLSARGARPVRRRRRRRCRTRASPSATCARTPRRTC